MEEDLRKVMKIVLTGGVILIFIILFFGTFYTIQSGQEGILLTFNKAAPAGIQPGLHLKFPLIQRIVKFNVRTQAYGASGTENTLESAASSDLQQVKMQLVVNYHLTAGRVPELFTNVGPAYEDTVIRPTVHEATKACTAKFAAVELINKREDVSVCMSDLLKGKLGIYNIVVEQVSITAFDFSEQFNNAIEQKVTAEQDALKARNKLEQIKMEAEQVRAAAAGQRDAKIATAEGEAQYIKLIQEQLIRSPQYIEYVKAKQWNGVLPQFYMSGSSNPLIMQLPSLTSSSLTASSSGYVPVEVPLTMPGEIIAHGTNATNSTKA
jgi:regulator of protease activity HflC (stomatin/prohibitin superfamily)